MEPGTKLSEFKEKLKELMEEYDAEIGLEWGKNKYGEYGRYMEIWVDGDSDEFLHDVINDLTL